MQRARAMAAAVVLAACALAGPGVEWEPAPSAAIANGVRAAGASPRVAAVLVDAMPDPHPDAGRSSGSAATVPDLAPHVVEPAPRPAIRPTAGTLPPEVAAPAVTPSAPPQVPTTVETTPPPTPVPPAPPPTTTTTAPAGEWRPWRVNPDGTPVRYDGCRTIPYVTRLHTGPMYARSELDWAVGQIEAASGLDLVWVGDVDEVMSGTWPVHVGFADEEEFFMPPSASGYAESDVENIGGGMVRYVGGRVVLRPDHQWTQGLTSTNPLATMFLHELGHLVGLAHVDSPHEIMTTRGNGTARSLGPGDRAGLSAVGRQGAC